MRRGENDIVVDVSAAGLIQSRIMVLKLLVWATRATVQRMWWCLVRPPVPCRAWTTLPYRAVSHTHVAVSVIKCSGPRTFLVRHLQDGEWSASGRGGGEGRGRGRGVIIII